MKLFKNIVSALESLYPCIRQSNIVYQITCSQCKLRFKEHIGSQGLLKKHFEMCNVFPSFEIIKIIDIEKLLILEASFISEI